MLISKKGFQKKDTNTVHNVQRLKAVTNKNKYIITKNMSWYILHHSTVFVHVLLL